MTYNFTYYYKGNLYRETYTDDLRSIARFMWLVQNNIAFKVITISKRKNRYYGG